MLYTFLHMSTLRNSSLVTAMELWHRVRESNTLAMTVYCYILSGAAGAIASLIHDGFMNPVDGELIIGEKFTN